MPFDSAVGDGIGLFPIAYLARVQYYAKHYDPSYNPKDDVAVAKDVVDNYIMKYPDHLSDGTFCRNKVLWCDDQFMGTALGARLSIYLNTTVYLDRLAPMQVSFWQGLSDPETNVTWHGYYTTTKTPSCCKWSRANGWGMMSHVEILKALKAVDPKSSSFPRVLEIFQAHARAAKLLQDTDGRWHQVLDVQSTFLETSTTGMFLLSFIEGVENGWLPKSEFDPVIKQAWKGLSTTVQADGTVTGICEGTGIYPSVSGYETRSTAYNSSSPGLGSVLKAALATARYLA
jgi:rhamnogalacturonyl hydrolase YesR